MTLNNTLVKSLASKLNLILRISKTPNINNSFQAKFSSCISDFVFKGNSGMLQDFTWKFETDDLFKNQGLQLSSFQQITDLPVNKKIIEPEKIIKTNVEIPLRNIQNKILELPFHIENDMTEPTYNIISKKTLNIIRIRRKKMRKHKRIKFRKRTKFEYAKRKGKRELEKEYNFQTHLKGILKEGETFNAEDFVQKRINTMNTPLPVTRVKGQLAPQWVIRDYLKEQEEKAKFKKRIEECIKLKS